MIYCNTASCKWFRTQAQLMIHLISKHMRECGALEVLTDLLKCACCTLGTRAHFH